jgi:signal transduction histidine kinase
MSVDAATAAIAHEVRTPLAAIALNASAALVQVQSGESESSEIEAILRDIEADAHRADRIISAVRALFKQTADRRITVSLNALVREALHLARPDLDANHVSVQIEFAEDHQVHVRVDATQLQQAVLNLLRNAMDAMRDASEGRRIKLTTRVIEKSTVILSVQDAGSGVPAEIKEHLFEPFFTTKVSGMGLGLAISRTLVENQGGRLALVTSGPDGTTFEISLPVLAEQHD